MKNKLMGWTGHPPMSTPPPRPTCNGNPPSCFPGAECRDTPEGPKCGRCPQGMVGDGKSCKPGRTCATKPCAQGNINPYINNRRRFKNIERETSIYLRKTYHPHEVFSHPLLIYLNKMSLIFVLFYH